MQRRLIDTAEFIAELRKQGFVTGHTTDEDQRAAEALLAWINNPPARPLQAGE